MDERKYCQKRAHKDRRPVVDDKVGRKLRGVRSASCLTLVGGLTPVGGI